LKLTLSGMVNSSPSATSIFTIRIDSQGGAGADGQPLGDAVPLTALPSEPGSP